MSMDVMQYEQRLLDLERELAARTAREMELGREQTDQGVADSGDASVADEDASADFTDAELNTNVLSEVRDALRRIEGGTFGLCETDGQPIEERRLEASPWVRYCLKHQKLVDASTGHRFPTM
jgi:DnaK suppressor protein